MATKNGNDHAADCDCSACWCDECANPDPLCTCEPAAFPAVVFTVDDIPGGYTAANHKAVAVFIEANYRHAREVAPGSFAVPFDSVHPALLRRAKRRDGFICHFGARAGVRAADCPIARVFVDYGRGFGGSVRWRHVEA
jgi:hypothetical protein